MVVERSTLALVGLPMGDSGYARLSVWVSNPLTDFYGCHGAPFIDQGVTTMGNQSLFTDKIANSAIIPNSAG